MLGKLIKYEIKATGRLLIPLYATLLIFALINRIINPLEIISSSTAISLQAILSFISFFIYVVLVIGIIIMTLFIMLQRFYKSLLSDEGYLMFTLPVKAWQHIICKLLVSLFWIIMSLAANFLSVLIITDIADIRDIISEIIKGVEMVFGNAGFIVLPTYALVMAASGIISIYTAISLGHLFTRHKILASFGMYCIIYIIYQIVFVLGILTLGTTMFPSIFDSGAMATPSKEMMVSFLLFFGIISIAMTAVCFTITNFILSKKLNLE